MHISELLKKEKSDNTKYRKNFDCGEKSLNDYIQKYARKQSEINVGQTHILFGHNTKKIISYFSISSHSIKKDLLASKLKSPVKEIPAMLIGRTSSRQFF